MNVDFDFIVKSCSNEVIENINKTIGNYNKFLEQYKNKFLCRRNLSTEKFQYCGKIEKISIEFNPFEQSATLNKDLRFGFEILIETTNGRFRDTKFFLTRESEIFDDEESARLFCEVSE